MYKSHQKYFFYLLFSILLVNCNRNEKVIIKAEKTKTSNSKKIDTMFNYNLKTKPKLFLKYWYKMSQEDFFKVSEILLQKKVLRGTNPKDLSYSVSNIIDYSTCFDRTDPKVIPKFINNKLINIRLSNCECIYPIYIEKYKIPELSHNFVKSKIYIENNPLYKPITSYIDGNEMHNLPDAFIDKSTLLPKGKKIHIKDNSPFYRRVLKKSPIIINKNEHIVIIIKQIKEIFDPIITYKYSIRSSKAFKNYKSENNLVEFGGISAPPFKYANRNSKLRTVTKYFPNRIDIIYNSREEVNKDEKKKNEILLERTEKKNTEKIRAEKRKKSVQNEI